MAKTESTPVTPTPAPLPKDQDVNPELAFKAAWDKDPAIRAVLTRTGRVRGNLKPSDIRKAQEIRGNYGV